MLVRDTGIEPVTLAKRRGRFRLIRYLRTFLVTWTRADLAGACLSRPSLRERRGDALDAGDAELRRLIREGFEEGIPASNSPRWPGCLCRASIR